MLYNLINKGTRGPLFSLDFIGTWTFWSMIITLNESFVLWIVYQIGQSFVHNCVN
jgi:hypothetical protein